MNQQKQCIHTPSNIFFNNYLFLDINLIYLPVYFVKIILFYYRHIWWISIIFWYWKNSFVYYFHFDFITNIYIISVAIKRATHAIPSGKNTQPNLFLTLWEKGDSYLKWFTQLPIFHYLFEDASNMIDNEVLITKLILQNMYKSKTW